MKVFLIFTLLFTLAFCDHGDESHRHEYDDDYDHEDEEDDYEDEEIKDSINWAEKGIVNTPIDQMSCGSCWSFVTTGLLEAKYAQMTGELVKMSEGFLVDCTFSYSGCAGGHPADGLQSVEYSQYIPKSSTYPWKGYYSKKCLNPDVDWKSDDNALKDVWVTYHRHVPGTEAAVLDAMQRGPVGVSFYISKDFLQYDVESHENEDHTHGKMSLAKRHNEELFEDVNCATDADPHSMVLVGYTDDSWIIKNSYGPNWGDHGYIHFKRSGYAIQCGIFKQALEVGMIPRREIEYKLLKGTFTYAAAQKRCGKLNKNSKNGWTLANIPTRMHWKQVLQLFQDRWGDAKKGNSYDFFWIGLSHADVPHCMWEDGHTSLEFHKYAAKQPSSIGTIKMSKLHGKWSSEKDTTKMRIVCSRYATCPKLRLRDLPNTATIVLGANTAELAEAVSQRPDTSVEGATVTITCKSGFQLHGESVGSCKGGVWTLPTCEK